MTDLDDLRFDRTGPYDQPPATRNRLWIALAVIVVLAALGAGYYYWRRPPAPKEAATSPQAKTAPPARLPAEPGENIPLPPLDESDPLVRELVARLSSHPRVAAWLTTDQLVRNFTVVVLAVSEGRAPGGRLRPLAPEGPFRVLQSGPTIHVDPRSYTRYDGHAAAVAGIDARGAARLYATLKPRIDDAYKELGSPHGDFDRTLERAIGQLLATPVVDRPLALEKAPASYRFADPALESLSSAQKQLLRMGPGNVRIVQEKLREIARHLGMS
jgi:Protein of unknown function (DUF3014)